VHPVAEVKYDNGQQDDDQDIVKEKWVHFFSDIAENREGFVKVAFSLSYKLPPKIYGFYIIRILSTNYGSQGDYSSINICLFFGKILYHYI